MLEFAASAPRRARRDRPARAPRRARAGATAACASAAAPTRTCSTPSALTLGAPVGARAGHGRPARGRRPAAGAGRPRAVRSARGDAGRGGAAMSAGKVLLWVILPYVAITVFVVGHWWRYRRDQFAWTSRSTQLLDRRVLGWASPAFHYGALAAVGGHIIGLCIPRVADRSAWGSPRAPTAGSRRSPGGIAGAVTLVGFVGLLYRRADQSPGCGARPRGWTSSPTSCSRS